MKGLTAIFEAQAELRDGSTYQTWLAALKQWKAYSQVEKPTIDGFRRYLLDHVQNNSAATYWAKFKAVLRIAVETGEIKQTKIPSLAFRDAPRNHFTQAEVHRLAQCDEVPAELKKMGLLSVLTGMRWSDIAQLRFSDIIEEEEGWALAFTIQKTGRPLVIPIDEPTREMLGQGRGRIFSLKYSTRMLDHFRAWCRAAGIERHATFHCLRHSYSFLQLEGGTDIYALKELLGHTSVTTTQIYASMSAAKKRQTVGRITLNSTAP